MSSNKNPVVRKTVHILTGCLILALSFILEKDILLILFIAGALFSFVTYNFKQFKALHKTSDSSLGTLFYPPGVIFSFMILYNQPLYYFQITLMVLTLSDTAAYMAGQIMRFNGSFKILGEKKSWYGTIAFSVTTLIIFYFFLPSPMAGNLPYILLALFLSVNLEVISFRGSDNFTIPFGLSLFFLTYENFVINPAFMLAGILLLASGSFLLYKWNILSRTGSLSAYLLGVYFLIIPGFIWIIPVLFFFITSVLFTNLNTRLSNKNRNLNSRNVWQVFANIIWALLSSVIFMITNNELFIYFFIALLAAVTADTWASELGPVINKRSFSVADFKMHPAGITGGISSGGTTAALAASVIISATSFYLFFGEFQVIEIIILSVSGFLACVADTLLGAFAEEKFMEWRFLSQKGDRLSPNDLVNILGSATAPLFFLILTYLT